MTTPTPPASGLSVEQLRELRREVNATVFLLDRTKLAVLALLDARLGEAAACSCGLADAEPWLHADWCARYAKPSPVTADLLTQTTAGFQDEPVPSDEKAKCDHMGCTVNATVGSPTGECTRCGGTVVFPTQPSPVPAAGYAGDATEAEVVEVVAFLTLVRNISNEDEYRQPEQLTMFDRAIALLERLSDNGWQPISTARQGEVVLFCDARGNRWSDCSPDMWHRNGCGYPPTHWRPLPPPPPSPTPTEPGAV